MAFAAGVHEAAYCSCAVPYTTAIVREPAKAAGSDFRDLRLGSRGRSHAAHAGVGRNP